MGRWFWDGTEWDIYRLYGMVNEIDHLGVLFTYKVPWTEV